MKAIRVKMTGGPEVMEIQDIPVPKPGPGEVVVRVQAAGVNPVDTYIRSGNYPLKLEFPYTPGFDGAGTIDKVGEEVYDLHIGDRVYIGGSLSGTYAEYALCRASQVHFLPARVSFAQGAGVNIPYATAYSALYYHAHTLAGETVLIHGASGGVGTAAVQIARAAGIHVIGTAGTERGQVLVRESGAHHVVNHSKNNYMADILAMTNGGGVDVILEMLANVNLNNDLEVLGFRGRVVIIGCRGKVEIDPRLAMTRDLKIIAMTLMNASKQELHGIHSALIAGLNNGTLNPVIGSEMPLEKASQAHTAVMLAGAYGKIILKT